MASRGYSGLMTSTGTRPLRTAGLGADGGASTGGGAMTTGSAGGVGVTAEITGSDGVVGTGMSGGGRQGWTIGCPLCGSVLLPRGGQGAGRKAGRSGAL